MYSDRRGDGQKPPRTKSSRQETPRQNTPDKNPRELRQTSCKDICIYVCTTKNWGILVLARSQLKPIFRIEVYRRIILQCNGSWIPHIDGLLSHMMFDENNYFSLKWKLEIYSN